MTCCYCGREIATAAGQDGHGNPVCVDCADWYDDETTTARTAPDGPHGAGAVPGLRAGEGGSMSRVLRALRVMGFAFFGGAFSCAVVTGPDVGPWHWGLVGALWVSLVFSAVYAALEDFHERRHAPENEQDDITAPARRPACGSAGKGKGEG